MTEPYFPPFKICLNSCGFLRPSANSCGLPRTIKTTPERFAYLGGNTSKTRKCANVLGAYLGVRRSVHAKEKSVFYNL